MDVLGSADAHHQLEITNRQTVCPAMNTLVIGLIEINGRKICIDDSSFMHLAASFIIKLRDKLESFFFFVNISKFGFAIDRKPLRRKIY